MPPKAVEQKVQDPENELNNVQRTFMKLAPACSVAKRALGEPQLAPQEKQLGILDGEIKETKLCISMATKGRHALHDALVKKHMRSTLNETEDLQSKLRDERAQLTEVSCLNYLSQKKLTDLTKQVTSEADELANVENALNRLKQSENRLEIATKRFCVVNYDNAEIRHEIHRLLVERKDFNRQWNRTITKLVKGKMFLMDIFEIATVAFGARDDCCRILDALKWKGLYGLNRDISEMQQFECDLNHLSKLEEFLRIKGSRRVCEADEKEENKRLEEIERCEREIARHDQLLGEIFTFSGKDDIPRIINDFKVAEIENFSTFQLLCQILQESIGTRRQVEKIRLSIVDQREMNQAREDREKAHLVKLREELVQAQNQTQAVRDKNTQAETLVTRVLSGIDELSRVAKCDISSLASLLGPHGFVTKWNVVKFLRILEKDVKTLMQIAYGKLTPPTPAKGRKAPMAPKIVADPFVETLRPNRIENLVSYVPCAYCVEDYIMNLIYETPVEVGGQEFIDHMLHLEDVNTPFEIYTLTIPAKRHSYKRN